MIRLPLVLSFTALTFLTWGVYGVLLHNGQDAMNHAYLKPFVGVGIAYFLIAVLIPGVLISQKGEKGHWSLTGTLLSLLAGAVGAFGALGIILALGFGGSPIYVMPFVFGLAPVVNTLVTSSINRTFNQISFLFVVGLVLVICGAAGVLRSNQRPVPKDEKIKPVIALSHVETPATARVLLAADSTDVVSDPAPVPKTPKDEPNMVSIIAAMIVAAFCWGAYGPVLHIGQSRMGGSRLRPFCCVGLAYFAIAVALPLAMIQAGFDRGAWDFTGMLWSIGAGAFGAIGALGIIYAFNFGGKPIFVMPLVFGFAPIINTITSLGVTGRLGSISPYFVGSLATTIAGAVMVLVFQPRAKHGKMVKPVLEKPTTERVLPATPVVTSSEVETIKTDMV